jgi:hypothetical protein
MDIERLYEKGIPQTVYSPYLRDKHTTKLNLPFADIDKRLADLEERVFANDKKVQTDLSQQMLLLHHLGIIDKFRELDISSRKVIKLLSLILNASEDNVKKTMTALELPKSKLKVKKNYKFLVETFSTLKMQSQVETTEKVLNEIIREEELNKK